MLWYFCLVMLLRMIRSVQLVVVWSYYYNTPIPTILPVPCLIRWPVNTHYASAIYPPNFLLTDSDVLVCTLLLLAPSSWRHSPSFLVNLASTFTLDVTLHHSATTAFHSACAYPLSFGYFPCVHVLSTSHPIMVWHTTPVGYKLGEGRWDVSHKKRGGYDMARRRRGGGGGGTVK